MNDAPPLPRCPICGYELRGTLEPTARGTFYCTRSTCGIELTAAETGKPRIFTFQLVEHYSLCVLPFSFPERDDFDPFEAVRSSGRWTPRTFSLTSSEDIDRTEYFLPYIRRFLFPSLFGAEKAPTATTRPAEPPCQHFEFALEHLGEADKKGLPFTLHCRDTRKKDAAHEYPLLLEKVELILFSYRVGFLILRYRCTGPSATFFDQMNSLVFLRTIAPLYQGFEMPELSTKRGRCSTAQLYPFLLAEFDGGKPPAATPNEVPAGTPLPVKPIYDDRMMIYTYSCLDRDTALEDAERTKGFLDRATIVNFEQEAIPLRQREDEDEDRRLWLRFRWQGYSKDGGSLVVFNTDRYHERFLGVYNATYYFDIFLLATFQRVTLLTLYERLSDIHALITGDAKSRKLLRRVRRDLLLFKNQCWFSQITNREKGLKLWKKWQKVFENKTLLKEVTEQSGELDTYLQSRWRERVEKLVRVTGFLAPVVTAILGLEVLFGKQEWVTPLRWVLLGLLVGGTGIYAWFVLYRQKDEV